MNELSDSVAAARGVIGGFQARTRALVVALLLLLAAVAVTLGLMAASVNSEHAVVTNLRHTVVSLERTNTSLERTVVSLVQAHDQRIATDQRLSSALARATTQASAAERVFVRDVRALCQATHAHCVTGGS